MARTLPLMLCAMLLLLPVATTAQAADGEPPREGGCANDLDVLFVFDTTGSMGGVLADAAAGAGTVMASVQGAVPNAAFGVAEYKDYDGTYSYPGYSSTYGGPGDFPWKLHQPVSTVPSLSSSAIGTLSAAGGWDGPESLTRAAYESYSDAAVGWRAGSTRVVVVFTDAPAHDDDLAMSNYGLDPGPDAIGGNADDLDFQATVAAAASAGIRFAGVGVGWNGGAPYLQHMASETDGAYAVLGSDFESQIAALILELAGIRAEAHADALLVDVSGPVSQYTDVAHVEAGPHVDAHQETLEVILLPAPVDGVLVTAEGSAAVTRPMNMQRAIARETIQKVSLLGGLVVADLLVSQAEVRGSTFAATGSAAGSSIAAVVVDGRPVTLTGPNTNVTLPDGLGWVTFQEEIVHQPTFDTAEVEVNAIHLHVERLGVVLDVKVSHAYASLSCTPTHRHGPTPPTDPVTPVDPVLPTDPTGPVAPIPPVDPPVEPPCFAFTVASVVVEWCLGDPLPPVDPPQCITLAGRLVCPRVPPVDTCALSTITCGTISGAAAR